LPAESLNFSSLDVSALILKMKKRPKLETRIRNRDAYSIIVGLLPGFSEERMFVDVKDAPGSIVL